MGAVAGAACGGYTAYELALYQNGLEIQRIRNVVFGELWLASGQSNMEFKMWETPEGDEMLDAGGDVFPNANVRILYTPQTYSGAPFGHPARRDPRQQLDRGQHPGHTQRLGRRLLVRG